MALVINDFSGVLTLTAPTGGVTVNTPLDIQGLIVLPLETADAAASFQGMILNSYNGNLITGAPKTGGTGLDWIQGEPVYYDISADEYTTVATGNNFAGWAHATAGATATVGDVICGFGQALV